MHIYYQLKDMLHDELAEIVQKGELSAGSLETIDKLLNSIKNACKIVMYDEYSEGGHSYAGDYSNARNTKRDSMGRYAREGGYSGARGGRSRYSRNDGYSYGGDNEKIDVLNEILSDASNEEEKRIIHKMIRKLENE